MEESEKIDRDRKWFQEFVNNQLNPFISKMEQELETLKNKKPKTGSKK
jgi:hypothetical protein